MVAILVIWELRFIGGVGLGFSACRRARQWGKDFQSVVELSFAVVGF